MKILRGMLIVIIFVLSISLAIFTVGCSNRESILQEVVVIKKEQKSSEEFNYTEIFYKGNRIIARRDVDGKDATVNKGKIPDGQVLSFYDSGEIEGMVQYRNGKRNGKAYVFYKQGSIMGEVNYEDDILIGSEIFYYENGQKWVERNWKDGVLQFFNEYDENGVKKE